MYYHGVEGLHKSRHGLEVLIEGLTYCAVCRGFPK